jgi:hypothetical protein
MVCPTEFRLFRGTENSRNSVVNHSTEEETSWNSVPWNKNKLRNFVLKHFAKENTLSILYAETGNFRLNRFLKTWQLQKNFTKMRQKRVLLALLQTNFWRNSVLFRASELTLS